MYRSTSETMSCSELAVLFLRNLVAWNCFVVGESLHHVLRPGLRLVRVNVEVSGSGTVLGRRIVVGSRCSVCPPFLDFPEIVLRFREPAEELGESGVHLSEDLLESVEEVLPRGVEVRLVLPKCFIVLLEVAFELNLSQDHANFFIDSNELQFA